MVSPRVLQTAPRLLNRYSIQQHLGARLGRRTLLGYDHCRNHWVVIKYLCFDDPIEANDVRRFRKETTVLKRLDHPAIPAYYDSFDIHEHGYHGLMVVQAYIEGQSLYALINAKRVFTEPDVRDLARQILAILDYLHTQKPAIIHRDIKPSSLVLSHASSQDGGQTVYQTGGQTGGQVYLVDFGLVQHTDQAGHFAKTPTPTENSPDQIADTPILISGTPGYRPPEQLGDRAVPATDLYSLGATLVHLATGQHPNTLPQRGLRILFGQELGHMSRPLKAWLRWLTQPKQHKRPISAQAALQGLDQADKIFAVPPYLSPTQLGHRLQRNLVQAMAPANAQFQVFEYSQTLEVLFPPLGWKNQRFWLALLQTVISVAGVGLVVQSLPQLWFQLPGQRLLISVIGLGGIYLSLRSAQRGLKTLVTTLCQQISIQLLPDIILVGYRFPCRPVDYQINTYRQDIGDIDLQPGSATLTFHLRRNRTLVGKLKHRFAAQSLGVTPAEMRWLNDILQLWLQQQSSKGLV